MGLLNGKVAIITGAGGGLGKAYALLFAREGAKVVVNDLGGAVDGKGGGSAMADEVVAEIKAAGGEAIANYASVADEAGAQSLVDDAIGAFGGLDVVVNNAGILRDRTLLKLSAQDFDLVLAVHARGTFLVGKASAEKMKELGKGGSIINTSSIAGLKGNFGQTNYGCAKAGIAGMTRVWALELVKSGIRTNAIAPMAKTRMTEDISAVPDDITPEQIAPMVLFLASDLSKDVNGRIFGCHGRHLFEYHMVLSPGVELDRPLWTATEIAERLAEISAIPSAIPSAEPGKVKVAAPDIGAQVDEVFQTMPKLFVPEKAAGWSTVIHFDIQGSGHYGVVVKDGGCTTSRGTPEGTRCNITYDSAQTLLGTITGKLNPQQAFMAGKIKADNMGDLMKFAQCFDMKKAAAVSKERATGGAPAERSVHQLVDQVFDTMPKLFVPERAGSWESVICFDVSGTGAYTVTVKGGACTATKGRPQAPKCTITYDSAETLLGTTSGKLNAQQAFMSGKIKTDNMGDLMKFAQCFDMKRAAAMAKEAAPAAPAAAGMNKALIGKTYRSAAEFIRREHTEAYARATDDLNPAYLEGDAVISPPLFPVRAFMRSAGEAVMDPELNADVLRLVHGEQDMRFHDVLRPWDLVAARARLESITDKSSGQLMEITQRLMRDGDVVCESRSGYFVRAKTTGEKKPAEAAPLAEPRDYLFERSYTVAGDQSYRYAEVSQDKNPIHVDEATAKAAGHPTVILHGMCTMAMTGREVVDHLCGGDPRRLARLKVRFTKIVLPGDTLTTRAWHEGEADGIRTVGVETVNQRGELVIGNGLAEIRP